MAVALPTKDCVVCGRSITWRKKWERDWDQVRYCSDACRRRARNSTAGDLDSRIEARLRELLDRTATGRTICPSDVARSLSDDGWRALMEPVRAAARRLVAVGEAEITQGGRVVDPSTAKGPIRIRPVR